MNMIDKMEREVNSLSTPGVLTYGAAAITGEIVGGGVLRSKIANNTSAYEAAQVKIKPLKKANTAITTVTEGGHVLTGTTRKESSVATFLYTRQDKNLQEIKKLEAHQPDQLPVVAEVGLVGGLSFAGIAAGVAVVYGARHTIHAVKNRLKTRHQQNA